MKVNNNNNGDLAAFLALRQLLMNNSAEGKPGAKTGEAEGSDLTPPSRHNVLQLVAAENLLASESSLPDLTAVLNAAGRARANMVADPASTVKGQTNFAPGTILELLQ